MKKYLQEHEIKKIYCFYFKKFKPDFSFPNMPEIEYIEYADIIEYIFFYRLLEEIDDKSLIIMNECMRTQKRSDLTYNCAHHYLNQTPHKIVFEFFPIIAQKEDFMILLDMINKGKYKGKGFDYLYLKDEDVLMKPFHIKFETTLVPITAADREAYEKRKEMLFDNLGQKDPDTIPRDLQLFVGGLKKKSVEPGKVYVARNKRLKLDNVFAYNDIKEPGSHIIIDMHYRRLNFNDYLKTSQNKSLQYLFTPLPVDDVIIQDFTKWKARVSAIYAQAGVYK